MTGRTFAQGMIVQYAARVCGRSDRKKGLSLDELRAVCFCIRERVRAGWHDGDWIANLEFAILDAGNPIDRQWVIDPGDRALQQLLQEIEDIFYGRELPTADGQPGLEKTITDHHCKYWCFLDRPKRVPFVESIMGDPRNHPQPAQMGLMMFFG